MLGEANDTQGGTAMALIGLLPLVTSLRPLKTVRHTQARFGAVQGPKAIGGGVRAGYEIRYGRCFHHTRHGCQVMWRAS